MSEKPPSFFQMILQMLVLYFSHFLPPVYIWLHVIPKWFGIQNLVGFLCSVSTLWMYFVRLAACARVFSHAGTYMPSVRARYETFNRSCVWTAISPPLLSEEAVLPNKTLITSLTPFKTSQAEGTSLFTTRRSWSMNIQPGQKMCYCSSWLEYKVQFKYSIFSSPFIEEVIKNNLYHNKTTCCSFFEQTRITGDFRLQLNIAGKPNQLDDSEGGVKHLQSVFRRD